MILFAVGSAVWAVLAWVGPPAGEDRGQERGPEAPKESGMEFVTRADKEQIEAKLAALIANRPVIAQRIAEARALGDLKENGDYHAAREQQGIEEAEIRRIQQRLASITVLDENNKTGDVLFIGMTARLREVDTGDEDLFKLVGEASATPPADYVEVTTNSPMGEALFKARVGDTIRVNAPRGVKMFEIIEILT